MIDIKILAFDMDGTLLNSEKMVSRGTSLELERLSENGVEIVLSSGRLHKSIEAYAHILPFKTSIVATNGSVVTDYEGRRVYEKPIDTDAFIKVVDLLYDYKMNFHFYGVNEFYRLKGTTSLNTYSRVPKNIKDTIDIIEYNNIKEIKESCENNSYFKVLLVEEDKKYIEEVRQELSKIDKIKISSSWTNNIEIVPEGVNKARSLKYLCKNLGLDLNNLMSFGDNNNDIEMIEESKVGVAMSNATNELKQKADFITDYDNDHDGIMKFLKQYF
ncbi:Cof-type HAD-IIB family hydrolase [Fenollaria massiliensis]|uniref:Cof-type HAD-IIB family hydrolase n=1 Tax=Fenollaria massiliensis TaxID=938288 RepID=UPI00036D17C6|nr:Cof-type HAD-IIB family hydrolase [Fenollaria massiliensis]